jgi:hypothetical protein
VSSTAKAKEYGWFGHVDSVESMFAVLDEFVEAKIIPDPRAIISKT